ncbi:hypothetical protein DY000_02063839 [Brassica cretica]|uniref:Ethylene insensitive 3-like DNA-binding domain-containing protein n=1 Tax=Brassica cretica TaxID=69181 RepID=A0ABQ7B403_BRACR|nr:hypothetical protein DY000_02063839 [Brassica cretica]
MGGGDLAISVADIRMENEQPDDLASDTVAEIDVSDEEIDAEDLERRMWKDRVRLKRIKESQKGDSQGPQAKEPPKKISDQAQRKKMSRAQDGILKYMLKLMEVCKVRGFVYGIIPEKGKPVSGSSDNIRAWWKEKVKFDKNGPAAIAKYEEEYYNINGTTNHHEEGVLEPNISLGPEENGLELVVPEFDSNYTYLPPVDGQAMMPVDERPMLYGANPNQELQFGSGYNYYNPSAVFVHNQEEDLIHTQIEMNSQAPPHSNGFDAQGGVLQPHGNEEVGVAGRDMPPQFQSDQDKLLDSNILSPFNDLPFDSSTFYSGFDSFGAFDDDYSWFGA